MSALILSVLFAAFLTTVGAFELFIPQLTPVYGQQAPLVLRVPAAMRLSEQESPDGPGDVKDVTFQHHRLVIPRGTTLATDNEDHRSAMRWDQARRPIRPIRLGAAFVLYLFGCLILTAYMLRFGHNRLRLMRSQLGLLSIMAAAIVLAKIGLLLTTLPAFWIPISAVSFWAALGFDRRTALLVDVAVSFMIASFLRFDLVLLTVFIVRGIVATLLFLNRKQPRQMLFAGLASGVAAAVAFASLTILMSGPAALVRDFTGSPWSSEMLACAGGGLLSGLLANMIREPAELVLGHVSRSRLLDLTDIETPLLRKLATEAPGSWEHSRAMANLAEAASASVGADSLLTRVGAYYHDLGKTVQHKYFIENLAPGEKSPHDELPPEVSADAIMAHVVVGTKILREGGVPEPVVEFAYTHHGTQVVEYFWGKYKQEVAKRPEGSTEPVLTRNHFRYPGMKPMTKETAILMLVDSIEAASRTVQPPEHDAFEEMIRRIVFHKLKSGQLDDSGITVTDLRILTQRVAATLVNMYHGRIKYPWQRKKEEAARRAQEEADNKLAQSGASPALAKSEASPGLAQSGANPAAPAAGSQPAGATDVAPTMPPPPTSGPGLPQDAMAMPLTKNALEKKATVRLAPTAPQPIARPGAEDKDEVSDEVTREVDLPFPKPDTSGRDRAPTVELPVAINLRPKKRVVKTEEEDEPNEKVSDE